MGQRSHCPLGQVDPRNLRDVTRPVAAALYRGTRADEGTVDGTVRDLRWGVLAAQGRVDGAEAVPEAVSAALVRQVGAVGGTARRGPVRRVLRRGASGGSFGAGPSARVLRRGAFGAGPSARGLRPHRRSRRGSRWCAADEADDLAAHQALLRTRTAHRPLLRTRVCRLPLASSPLSPASPTRRICCTTRHPVLTASSTFLSVLTRQIRSKRTQKWSEVIGRRKRVVRSDRKRAGLSAPLARGGDRLRVRGLIRRERLGSGARQARALASCALSWRRRRTTLRMTGRAAK